MNPEVQKIINERMNELPKHTQDALRDLNWEDTLRIIGYRNTLLIDQIEILHRETYLLLLGLISPVEYQEVLEKELTDIDFDLLQKILREIIVEIFEPLKEDIMKRNESSSDEHHELFSDAKSEKTSTPTRPLALHPKRDDILSGIENPTKSTDSISKLKLDDMFTQKPQTSPETPQPQKDAAPTPPAEPAPAPAPSPDAAQGSVKQKIDYRTEDDDPYLEPIDEE